MDRQKNRYSLVTVTPILNKCFFLAEWRSLNEENYFYITLKHIKESAQRERTKLLGKGKNYKMYLRSENKKMEK